MLCAGELLRLDFSLTGVLDLSPFSSVLPPDFSEKLFKTVRATQSRLIATWLTQ